MVESLEAQPSRRLPSATKTQKLPRCLMPQQFGLCDFLPTAAHAAVQSELGGHLASLKLRGLG